MGCDIHLFIESKSPHSDAVWRHHNGIDGYSVHGYSSRDLGHRAHGSRRAIPWRVGRDYRLFGVLADVRNYNHLTPLTLPIGIPSDMSDPVAAEYDRWYADAHSAHHCTLDLLLADGVWDQYFDGDVTTGRGGFVDFIRVLPFMIGAKPENIRLVFWFDN